MKVLKLILIGVALLSSPRLFAQNVQVANNTILTNGTVTFNFAAPPPPAVCNLNPVVPLQSGGVVYVNTTNCTGLTLVSVDIVFDDPLFPCQPNPQPTITLTPSSPNGSYTNCPVAVWPSPPPPTTTYTFNLAFVGADWVLTVN